MSSSSTSSFIACYGSNTLVSTEISNTNNISTILTDLPKTARLKTSSKLNGASSNSSGLSNTPSGPNEIVNEDKTATISNYYSMGATDQVSHYQINLTQDDSNANYAVYSNYPQVFSLSTFGRNDEHLNGGVTIKNNYILQLNSKNSGLSKVDLFSSNIPTPHTFEHDIKIVNRMESKIFPRTNPLCGRNYGTRCKTPDTHLKANNVGPKQNHNSFLKEIEFDICSKL